MKEEDLYVSQVYAHKNLPIFVKRNVKENENFILPLNKSVSIVKFAPIERWIVHANIAFWYNGMDYQAVNGHRCRGHAPSVLPASLVRTHDFWKKGTIFYQIVYFVNSCIYVVGS